MKLFALWIIGLVFFQTGFGQSGFASKSAALRNAGYAVCAIDAETGEVLFQTPQVSLVPASVMKLVTTATALEILGPEFRFHTQLGFTGAINSAQGLLKGDLVLKGGCDPAFYSEYFAEHYRGTFQAWADAIVQKGITLIDGNLILDLSQLSGQPIPGGWLWEDIGNYYGAGISALTYSDNSYKIHFSSSEKPGELTVINHITPTIDSLRLANLVVSSTINRDQTVIYGAPGSLTQLVEGSIPGGRADFVVKGSMPDPSRIAAAEFVKEMQLHGIRFSGKIISQTKLKTTDFLLLADKSSPPLQELIVPLNHESINLFAEHLLREIGRFRKGSTTLSDCVEAMKEFWTEKAIYTDGFYPTDGSGLSRSNGICPRTLTEVIRTLYLSKNRDYFFKSLPVAGQSGTLQSAFKGSKLENNLQAKTGSMARVRSLAGMFTREGGQKVIFAVIVNNFQGSQREMGSVMEGIVGELMSSEQIK